MKQRTFRGELIGEIWLLTNGALGLILGLIASVGIVAVADSSRRSASLAEARAWIPWIGLACVAASALTILVRLGRRRLASFTAVVPIRPLELVVAWTLADLGWGFLWLAGAIAVVGVFISPAMSGWIALGYAWVTCWTLAWVDRTAPSRAGMAMALAGSAAVPCSMLRWTSGHLAFAIAVVGAFCSSLAADAFRSGVFALPVPTASGPVHQARAADRGEPRPGASLRIGSFGVWMWVILLRRYAVRPLLLLLMSIGLMRGGSSWGWTGWWIYPFAMTRIGQGVERACFGPEADFFLTRPVGRGRYVAGITAIAVAVTALAPAILWTFPWPQAPEWIQGRHAIAFVTLWGACLTTALLSIIMARWGIVGFAAVALFWTSWIFWHFRPEIASSVDSVVFWAMFVSVLICTAIIKSAVEDLRERGSVPGRRSSGARD